MNHKFLLSLALLGLGGGSSAATYYVSDCQSGAASGCVAGNDANNGTSAATPWRSTAKVRSEFANLNAGDKILFARGGAWTNAAMDPLQNLRSTAANPITFDSYAAPWNSKTRPILVDSRDGATMFGFTDGGSPEPDAGYVVRNLDLRGEGLAAWGVFTSQQTSDVLLENLNIQGFSIGVYCGDAIQRVTLRNSTLKDNRNQGVLWSCSNSLIENNKFDNNGFARPIYDHSLYLAGVAGVPTNITARGNTVTRNSETDGLCQAVPLVVHGVVDGLLIENNTLYQAPSTVNPGCWGIAVDPGYGSAEGFQRVVIRGNRLVNMGGLAMRCAGCTAPVIENNVIVQETGDLVGISVPDRVRGSNDAVDSGAVIRNNSIYFHKAADWSAGISVASQGSSSVGTNVKIVSNLIYFAAGGASRHACFDLTGTSSANFSAFDNNLCFHAGGDGSYSWQHTSLTDAQGAGFDAHGINANPRLATVPSQRNKWVMPLTRRSPAVSAGHDTHSAPKDITGDARTDADIGAWEFSPRSDSFAPAAPTGVTVQ